MANTLVETAVTTSSSTRAFSRRFNMQSLTPWIGL